MSTPLSVCFRVSVSGCPLLSRSVSSGFQLAGVHSSVCFRVSVSGCPLLSRSVSSGFQLAGVHSSVCFRVSVSGCPLLSRSVSSGFQLAGVHSSVCFRVSVSGCPLLSRSVSSGFQLAGVHSSVCFRVSVSGCPLLSRSVSGFQLAGVQFSRECWCGQTDRDIEVRRVSDAQCDSLCPTEGKRKCGGYLTMGIFHTGLGSKSSSPHSSPTIGVSID